MIIESAAATATFKVVTAKPLDSVNATPPPTLVPSLFVMAPTSSRQVTTANRLPLAG